ncbi:DUF4214 domain-containing protein [Aquihabitans sp. McL0605]|uniref:DUF4214 domain-containing protein n=1 Tax=Aquihabitans sp. McL0605 TaxID=3415671 RepID=UPI003CEF0301
MGSRRALAAALSAVVLGAGIALVAPGVAGADGATPLEVSCTGIPIINSTTATASVTGTDDVDPVVAGSVVNDTLHVPVPVGDVPVDVTVTEVKIVVPIPTGVTIDDVTFTPSSFSGQTWSVSGSSLTATFTGSVKITNGGTPPSVPDVQMKTTVAGPARTISWTSPTSITAKASTFLGPFNASCTATNPNTVLISTTVVDPPNQAPTATDQSVAVAYGTAKAITLAGTDPESSPLTFATTSSPAHGALSGTAPNLTYTPANGYSGPDSFTFSASDGSLSDSGTVSITVAAPVATVPGAPAIGAVTAAEGQATVVWTAPPSDGGSALTGYVVTPYAAGVARPTVTLPAGTTSTTITGLANGVVHTFEVAATNAVGTGPQSAASTAVTPQWWMPWTSGPVAVTEMYTWLTGQAPTSAEKASWLAQLNSGAKLPGDLVAALRTGTDATVNVDPTVRLYSAYLVRVPDANGLNYWLGKKRSGWSLTKISSSFAASSEFTNRYGPLSNKAFVDKIYENVLGRPGEASGVAYWTAQLDQKKKNRGQVMTNFSESSEYKRKQVGNTDAAVIYIHLLGRTPTLVQRNAFAAALALPTSLATLVRDQIHQPSFATRAG